MHTIKKHQTSRKAVAHTQTMQAVWEAAWPETERVQGALPRPAGSPPSEVGHSIVHAASVNSEMQRQLCENSEERTCRRLWGAHSTLPYKCAVKRWH